MGLRKTVEQDGQKTELLSFAKTRYKSVSLKRKQRIKM